MTQRRTSRLRGAGFAIVLPLTMLPVALVSLTSVDSEAAAEGKRKKKGDAGLDKNDPDNVRAISKFIETTVKGNRKYAARDWPGAIGFYREAIALAPRNPYGHYLLGEAQLASGNVPEAEASFRQAETLSDDRNIGLRAKIFFVLADLLERQKKFGDAKAAWQAYTEYAGKHDDAGIPIASGTARIQAVEGILALEKDSEAVRARIAAEDGGAPAEKK